MFFLNTGYCERNKTSSLYIIRYNPFFNILNNLNEIKALVHYLLLFCMILTFVKGVNCITLSNVKQ